MRHILVEVGLIFIIVIGLRTSKFFLSFSLSRTTSAQFDVFFLFLHLNYANGTIYVSFHAFSFG